MELTLLFSAGYRLVFLTLTLSTFFSLYLYPYHHTLVMARMPLEPLIVGRVIGEVLDSFTTSMKMTVSYNKKQVYNGHELFPSSVNTKPKVQIEGADMRSFFTLVSLFPPLFLFLFSLKNKLMGKKREYFSCYLLLYIYP